MDERTNEKESDIGVIYKDFNEHVLFVALCLLTKGGTSSYTMKGGKYSTVLLFSLSHIWELSFR